MTNIIAFTNRSKSSLANGLSTTDAQLQLSPGTGGLFPQAGNGTIFYLTLVGAASNANFEIVAVINRVGDTCTILRAQDGTTARTFQIGDVASLNLTAGNLGLFPQAGYMGVFNEDVAKIIGGYSLNAMLADPSEPGTLWISKQTSNMTAPGKGNGWDKLNITTMMDTFVDGASGVNTGNGDLQGKFLHSVKDTDGEMEAFYEDTQNSWLLARKSALVALQNKVAGLTGGYPGFSQMRAGTYNFGSWQENTRINFDSPFSNECKIVIVCGQNQSNGNGWGGPSFSCGGQNHDKNGFNVMVTGVDAYHDGGTQLHWSTGNTAGSYIAFGN